MIGSLITSQTRIRLLKKFFLNSSTKAHLRGLEAEFGESSNAIRVELNRLEKAGLLESERQGNKKIYYANKNHPLFCDIHSIILKELGIDKLVTKVIGRIGELLSIYLIGEFAVGRDSQVIEIIIIGDILDRNYLARKISQAEDMIKRKICYEVFHPGEVRELGGRLSPNTSLLLWDCQSKKALNGE